MGQDLTPSVRRQSECVHTVPAWKLAARPRDRKVLAGHPEVIASLAFEHLKPRIGRGPFRWFSSVVVGGQKFNCVALKHVNTGNMVADGFAFE